MPFSIPTSIYGQLEDLLREIQLNLQNTEMMVRGLRLGTRSVTTNARTGEAITDVSILVTSLTTGRDFAEYHLWSWHVDTYAYIHDRPLSSYENREWTRQDSALLVTHLLGSLSLVIQQETGIEEKRGLYSVEPAWLNTTGTTDLVDRLLLKRLVKPPDGRVARRLSSSLSTLVLGTMIDDAFQELPESALNADDRIHLVSPDLVTQWLEYPNAYEVAIAAKEETLRGVAYQVLYDPTRGWTGTDFPADQAGE